MSKTLFLSGLANFEEDVVQEITFDRYAEYQRSIGKPVDVDPINFPQKIEFEFASNALITNHYITSSEPLKFRYIYDGRFEYDEAGSMKFASIDSVTVAYQDLYPGDEYEYGYFYKTSSPVVIEDVNNFSQWEDAMNSAMDDSAVVHEYEEQDGVIKTLAGSGKGGVFRPDNSHLLPPTWHKQLFDSDLLNGSNSQLHYGTSGNDDLNLESGDNFKHDIVNLLDGDDRISTFRGADKVTGGGGDDILRAGNGRDVIAGNTGRDAMFGGFGRNTFNDSRDGNVDSHYFMSDQWSFNWIYNSAGNSPNGEKADIFEGLDPIDEVFVQGVATEQLSFGSVNHTFGDGQSVSGIGIFAQGVLEAVYAGGDLTAGQLQNMTSGFLI